MKQKLFVDFDGTIINTIQAYVDTYNELYSDHPNFQTAESHLVNQYNMKDQCNLIEDMSEIFTHHLFFQFAEFINDNTYEVLEKLNDKYQLIICSIGVPKNLAHKTLWLEEKLPFIKDYVLINNTTCKMSKSIVNMQDSIFIDDIPSNLESSNADKNDKYLFGKIYPWNEGWIGNWCWNWDEVGERLL